MCCSVCRSHLDDDVVRTTVFREHQRGVVGFFAEDTLRLQQQVALR